MPLLLSIISTKLRFSAGIQATRVVVLNKINVLCCAFRKFNTEYRLFLLRKGLFLFHFVGWKFVPEKCNQQDGEYGAQCHND